MGKSKRERASCWPFLVGGGGRVSITCKKGNRPGERERERSQGEGGEGKERPLEKVFAQRASGVVVVVVVTAAVAAAAAHAAAAAVTAAMPSKARPLVKAEEERERERKITAAHPRLGLDKQTEREERKKEGRPVRRRECLVLFLPPCVL